MGEAAHRDFGMKAVGFVKIESRVISFAADCHESIDPFVMGRPTLVACLDLVVGQVGLFEKDFATV